VDLHQFAPAPKDAGLLRELAIQGDDVVVMHASNLKPIKRPLDVVHSAEHALRHNPKLVYVIVGDGACRQPMEDLCARRGLSERFRFVGWIEYARLPRYMNLADLVIMPSDSEGLARVYLETQACARLLLASDIPAAREVITDGETGLLFRTGDIDDLTTKTLAAAGDPELRARIGRQACRRVRANALERAVAAYVDAIGSVVSTHRSEG
jgi:glycosyltransferase involved in cell wall biosynthesis